MAKRGNNRRVREPLPRKKAATQSVQAEDYHHPESTLPMRPEVGTQAQFRKKKPPQRYRYDSSLAPTLEWDGQNPAREQGEALIAEITEQAAKLTAAKTDVDREAAAAAIQAAAEKLRALGKPFLNWAGKAERLSFDVPTLPLFVHERLSTRAIIETLLGHKRDKQMTFFDLFGDPAHSVTDQVLKAYEYQDKWVNRMILGDSLAVMNSLLHYESLGGQVQMIYMDPPYGVKFGSNFQPFVRRRDVKHNDDEDLTREPEMVQAYRDTWELGLHSYLSYLRDRLLIARELLHPSGSIFVQISDENLHHVREVMDEVFGAENFVNVVVVKKASPLGSAGLTGVVDFLIWYAREKPQLKFRQLFQKRDLTDDRYYSFVELPDGRRRSLTSEESDNRKLLPQGARLFTSSVLVSSGLTPSCVFPVEFEGRVFNPATGRSWRTNPSGMERLKQARRLLCTGNTLRYISFDDDFPYEALFNLWSDTGGGAIVGQKLYTVQTPNKVVQRCLLMTTDPGDLVLDPTCGSGTTAYVAEQWGRRWITIDVSRVPLALARQRLLTATFPWHELKDEARGPAGGYVYKRRQNSRGEEVGGIVPHVTLKSIANDEPPTEEVLVDRPEPVPSITRVTGPFTFEGTIPTPVDFEGDGEEDSGVGLDERQSFTDRMLEVLRRSPVLRLGGNKTINLAGVRPPAKTLSLSAEAVVVNGADRPVAFVFGPENGAVSETLVFQAAREATAKNYAHLYVVGFAIQPNARALVEQCEAAVGVPATYVQATPDLLMGDLLKNMRSSQIFSVCGLPEVGLRKVKAKGKNGSIRYQVELLGLDVFDPITMESEHRRGQDVPAWFLDADYNDLCFHVSQAFFPRTAAWNNLRRAIKGEYDESVWDHLAGTVSAPFEAGNHGQVAVKVIDDRGNELIVTKKLTEAR